MYSNLVVFFQHLSSSASFLLDFLYPSQMVAAPGFACMVFLESVIALDPKDPSSTLNHLIMSQWGKCHSLSSFLPSDLPRVVPTRGHRQGEQRAAFRSKLEQK